ncbi:MAG: alpha/beta hydrolase-fold protein [Myxococcota bacterium]|nr:alpha/beta hydrolase-fold protein [Myxococcota bacterium]
MLYLCSLLFAAEPRFEVQSKALNKEIHYTVWLPKSVDPQKEYPLLIMLHGLGDSDLNWSRGRVLGVYRSAVDQGLLEEHIVLVPNGERGYWSNHLDTSRRYGDWVLEAVSDLERRYRVAEDPSRRTLMGLSMGAFGALSIGLQHPEQFGQLVAMSPTEMGIAASEKPNWSLYTNVLGDPIHQPYLNALEPREWILRGAGQEQRIALIYGAKEQDKFYQGALRLQRAAAAQGIEIAVLEVEEGTHSWKSTWVDTSFLWWMSWLGEIQRGD